MGRPVKRLLVLALLAFPRDRPRRRHDRSPAVPAATEIALAGDHVVFTERPRPRRPGVLGPARRRPEPAGVRLHRARPARHGEPSRSPRRGSAPRSRSSPSATTRSSRRPSPARSARPWTALGALDAPARGDERLPRAARRRPAVQLRAARLARERRRDRARPGAARRPVLLARRTPSGAEFAGDLVAYASVPSGEDETRTRRTGSCSRTGARARRSAPSSSRTRPRSARCAPTARCSPAAARSRCGRPAPRRGKLAERVGRRARSRATSVLRTGDDGGPRDRAHRRHPPPRPADPHGVRARHRRPARGLGGQRLPAHAPTLDDPSHAAPGPGPCARSELATSSTARSQRLARSLQVRRHLRRRAGELRGHDPSAGPQPRAPLLDRRRAHQGVRRAAHRERLRDARSAACAASARPTLAATIRTDDGAVLDDVTVAVDRR